MFNDKPVDKIENHMVEDDLRAGIQDTMRQIMLCITRLENIEARLSVLEYFYPVPTTPSEILNKPDTSPTP